MKTFDSLAERWPLLNTLLDEALALPTSERGAWLDALPAEAAGLRDTLGALLASHARVETGDFLGTLPKFTPGAAAGDGAVSPDAGAGDLVGPYRLLSLLGRGGMGDVWLAERADGELKRPVALKLPRVAWGGALEERLRRERDILATLAHPHIARLYDAGIDARGRPYLALEYVDGQPIDAYCRERGLPLDERLGLLLQVAAAVAHAHARLVVHRDLKPSNILVTADGEVRLLDFGIAKLMQDDLAAETRLTQVGGRLLTLDYASPEQIRGEPLGTASDVYSLAVVSYELLTDSRPYRLKRGSAAELEEAIANADAPLASQSTSDLAVRKQLRGDLDAVLHQALKKDPAQRYPTVVAFADDIQRHLDGRAVRAVPDSRLYRARKLLRRHGLALAVSSTVVLLLAVGLGVALWQSHEASLQAQRAQRSADRESAVSTLYLETLTTVAGWDAARFAEANAVPRAMAEKLEELEKRYQHSPEQQTALMDVAATQLPYMGDFDGGLAISKRLVQTLERTGASPEALLTARSQAGRTLRVANRHAESEVVMRAALAGSGLSSVPPAVQARAWVGLGSSLHFQGKRREARQALNEALVLLQRQPAPKIEAEALQSMSETYRGLNSPAALQASQQAHAALLTIPALDPAYLGASHLYVGAALADAGRPGDAERALRDAKSRFEPLYGEVHSDTVKAVGRLGMAIAAQGRCAEARQLLAQRAVAVQKRPGPDTPFAAQTVKTRQLDLELACGDVSAAAKFSASNMPADALALAPLDVLVSETMLRTALGKPREAALLASQRLKKMRPEQQVGGLAFKLRLALAEAQWAADEREEGDASIRALLDLMRREEATSNWTYQHATEWAARAAALRGESGQAVAMLQKLDERPAEQRTPAFAPADRVDSALRRAQVWLSAGEREKARALLAAAEKDLARQHPGSPRLTQAHSLATAAGT